jgi:hypothetical protein
MDAFHFQTEGQAQPPSTRMVQRIEGALFPTWKCPYEMSRASVRLNCLYDFYTSEKLSCSASIPTPEPGVDHQQVTRHEIPAFPVARRVLEIFVRTPQPADPNGERSYKVHIKHAVGTSLPLCEICRGFVSDPPVVLYLVAPLASCAVPLS